MYAIEKEITTNYKFDTTHKGAPYTIDGEHWMNNGEFSEILTKLVLGYELKKDANTRYDEGSDIPERNASVKASRFSLTSVYLGDTKEEIIKNYFKTVHSTEWIYTTIIENIVKLYIMNAEEFKEFLENWTTVNERKVLRGKITSGKMIKWFEERV